MLQNATRLGVLVAMICATSACSRPAPNPLELGYNDLAKRLGSPEPCARITPGAVEYGGIFGSANRGIYFLRSSCFMDVAANTRDLSLCARVDTTSSMFRSGNGVSREACETDVKEGRNAGGGAYGNALMVFATGYTDEDVARDYPDHRQTDKFYDFLASPERHDELRSRVSRVPDFSKGDSAARKSWEAAMPACAGGKSATFACRVTACGFIRDGDEADACMEKVRQEFGRPVS
jgi:hypothetical protein